MDVKCDGRLGMAPECQASALVADNRLKITDNSIYRHILGPVDKDVLTPHPPQRENTWLCQEFTLRGYLIITSDLAVGSDSDSIENFQSAFPHQNNPDFIFFYGKVNIRDNSLC